MIMLSDVYMLYISIETIKKMLLWVFIDDCKETLYINCSSLFVYACLVLVSLPLYVSPVVGACDYPIPNVWGELMVSRMDLPLGGMVDGTSIRLEVVPLYPFSLI